MCVVRRWRAGAVATLAVLCALLVTSCGGLALTVANAPALIGPFQRHADLAYGQDRRQRLDVYTPRKARALPVVIFWYGGGWTNGARGQYRFVGAALAEAGYVSVLPDYRLYPHARFPQFVDDGAAAVRWVRDNIARYGGDPDRLILMGHSAGAHMAASLAWQRSRLAAVGVPQGAIRGLVGMSGPYQLAPNTRTLNEIFAAPYTAADWQPIRAIDRGSPPSLLLHGGADGLVWPSNAENAAAALVAAGVRGEVKIYPGRGHADIVAALSVPARGRAPVLADAKAFMQSLLAAAPP